MLVNHEKLSKEEKVVITCSSFSSSNSDILRSIDLFNEKINWNQVCNLAEKHGVSNLLTWNLKRLGVIRIIPDDLRINLEERLDKTRNYQDKYYDEIASIMDLLEKRNLILLFLKGVALSQTLYKDCPEVRPFGDIDILVPEDQANKIFTILTKETGYHCHKDKDLQKLYVYMAQHYAPLSKKGLSIDIHHRLTQRFQPYPVNTSRIIKDAVTISLNGTEILIPAPEDMLLHLCIHLYYHHVTENNYELNHHADIYNMLFSCKNIKWDKFVTNTLKDRLNLPVTYSLYYTNIIYGNIIPKQVLQNIMPPEFEKEKDAIKNRALLSDATIGFWYIPYLKRLFGNREFLLERVKECTLSYIVQEKWANACGEIGIRYRPSLRF